MAVTVLNTLSRHKWDKREILEFDFLRKRVHFFPSYKRGIEFTVNRIWISLVRKNNRDSRDGEIYGNGRRGSRKFRLREQFYCFFIRVTELISEKVNIFVRKKLKFLCVIKVPFLLTTRWKFVKYRDTIFRSSHTNYYCLSQQKKAWLISWSIRGCIQSRG